MSVALGDAFNRGQLDAFVTNISERGYIFQNNNLRLNETDASAHRFRNVAEGADRRRGVGVGRAVRRLQQRRRQRAVRRQRLHLRRSRQELLVRDVQDRRRQRRAVRGRGDVARRSAMRASPATSGRASTSIAASPAGWMSPQKVGANDLYDGRAVALADLSNRGAVDVIVANQNQPAVLYRDHPRQHQPLDRRPSRRHAQQPQRDRRRGGARGVGPRSSAASIDGGSGFASQNDRRLHFGLGTREWVDRVVISWPSGEQQVVTRPPIDRIVTITEPQR